MKAARRFYSDSHSKKCFYISLDFLIFVPSNYNTKTQDLKQ